MSRRDPHAGVALLEMMIALVVMGMIALMIASAFGFHGRSLKLIDDRSALVDEALARNTLRRWIEAIPLSAQYIGANPETRFVGERDRLRFTTFMPNGPFWAGDPIHVAVSRDEEGRLMVRAEGTHLTSREPLVLEEALGRVEGQVRFHYYGRQALHDRPGWHEGWDGRERLPDLVRIETDAASFVPLALEPGLKERQSFMSRSSLLPPVRPSRP